MLAKGLHRQRQSRTGLAICLALLAFSASAATLPVANAAHEVPGSSLLPDHRGWEMVSPVEKNGGGVALPDEAGPGSFQVAPNGTGVAYASKTSFADPQGAAPYSNYIATRTSSGWSTENITPAQLAGAYEGAAYVSFSKDPSLALMLNPSRCASGPCPAGYQLVQLASGERTPSPADPGEFAGASDELDHIAFSEGADLFSWSPPSAALTTLNHLPADSLGAISTGALRAYWQGQDGNLYLSEAGANTQIDLAQGGGGDFEAASTDGSVAFFSKSGHLYRYVAGELFATEITPSGGAQEVLGASANGAVLFYSTGAGISRWQAGQGSAQALGGATDATSSGSGVGAAGARFYFTTAAKLVGSDVNLADDVYQWQARGTGDCQASGGCVDLISSGLSGSSTFAGASASGNDVFFLSTRSLVSADPGAVDLYDARVGGAAVA